MKTIDYFYLLRDIEINVGNLYKVFFDTNKEDKQFWWLLSIEEFNHASLLETCIEFLNNNIDVLFMINDDIEKLIDFNSYLELTTSEYLKSPNRMKSFEIAISIENDASETHFETVMTEDNTDNYVLDILKRLNKDDINHSKRIMDYYNNIIKND